MTDERQSSGIGSILAHWHWGLLLLAYSLLATLLPPLDDEVYYWSWSKSPQWSYYDHPGMTAWLIWLSTRIFGDTLLGMRFPACCCTTLTLVSIAHLLPIRKPSGWRNKSPDLQEIIDTPTGFSDGFLTQIPPSEALLRRVANWGIHPLIVGVALTPLFTFGGILITPDAPLIACWSLYLVWLSRLVQRLNDEPAARIDWLRWILGGVILGCGGLSKYTMILAAPAGLASLLCSRVSWRKWGIGWLLHGVVSVIVASPILIYNLQRNFEPLLFQWRHAMHDEPATVITFAEFFGTQLVLFGTLPFYLAQWTIRRVWDFAVQHSGNDSNSASGPAESRWSAGLQTCACLYLVPLLFFAYKAAKTELEGNWGLVAFLSVWPVAAHWYETVRHSATWRRLAALSFLIPVVAVTALTVHLIAPLPLLPPEQDRLSKQRGRWEMSKELARFIRDQDDDLPTFHHTYQLTALLRFHGVDARQEGTTRPSHYTFPPQSMRDFPAVYLVTEPGELPESSSSFGEPQLLRTFSTKSRGVPVHEYQLWRCERSEPTRSGD